MGRPHRARRIATATVARAATAAVLLALALGAAAPARAQFWPELTDKQKKGRLRLGPLALTPRLEMRNAGVDTNVFVTSANPVQDTTIVLRASSDVFVPMGRRLRLAGTGWLDFNYFGGQNDQGSVDPGAQGRVEADAWRLTFVAGGGAFSSSQLYSTDINERIKRNEDWVNLGFRLRLTSQFRAEAGVEDHRYRWYPTPDQDQAVKAQLDRDSVVWWGALRYKITPLTDLVASADKIDDTFLVAPPGRATTTSYRYLAGFEFGEKAFITGRFVGGLRDIPADSAGSVEPYSGPAFQASITAPFLQRFRFGLGYVRDVYYSSTGGRLEEGMIRNTYTDGLLSANRHRRAVRAGAAPHRGLRKRAVPAPLPGAGRGLHRPPGPVVHQRREPVAPHRGERAHRLHGAPHPPREQLPRRHLQPLAVRPAGLRQPLSASRGVSAE